jgi:Zn-dependent peptidase ImmA (M78 family)
MAEVAVSERVLRWALARSNRTVGDLTGKFPKIQEWLSGENRPSLRQVEALAKATLTPLGFFFLAEPPEDRLPIPYFRTLGDTGLRGPSPDLLDTLHAMQQRQTWMREYLIEDEQKPLPFVKSATIREQAKSIAQRMRDLLGFEAVWAARQRTWTDALGQLREKMETVGILVVTNGIVGNNTHRKLDPGEFRGFVLVDEYAPLVFVNGSDSKAAQMFTLGHELAHVFLGSSAAFDLRQLQPANNTTEIACNQVAAEFLVPEDNLRALWKSVSSLSKPFLAIARQFKVSELVAARRALDLNLIKRDQFFEFYEQYQQSDWHLRSKGSDSGNFYNNQNFRVGRRFASTVIRAVREDKLLYSEAYKLTDLYGKTFDQYVSKIENRELQ